MRNTINLLVTVTVMVIFTTSAISQTLSNSITNDGCRTSATGTLTVSTPQALAWEEGELVGSTVYTIETWPQKTKTFNYSTTLYETYYRAKVNSTTYTPWLRIRNFYPPVPGTLSGNVTSVGNVGGNPTISGTLTLSGHSGTIVKWQSSVNGTSWSDIANTTTSHTFTNLTQATHFRVVVGRSGCSNANSGSVHMNFPPPVAGTVSAAATYSVTGSGSVTLSGYTGTIVKWQSSTNGTTWTDIAHTSATYTYTNLTLSTYFRAVVGSYNWPDVNSNSVLINVLTLSGPSSMYKDGVATLTLAGINLAILEWEYSTDGGNSWKTESCIAPTLKQPIRVNTSFRVKLNATTHGFGYSNVHTVTVNTSSYSAENPVTGVAGQNYVRDQRVAVSGITTPAAVDALASTSKHEGYVYADGLGRGVQSNAVKASPLQKDLVSFSVYDTYGTNAKQYLPYASATGSGSYTATFLTEQAAYYTNGTTDKVEDTTFPFAETKFDNSPLFRVTEQGSAGADWQIGSGHTITTSVTSNLANEVRQFNADGTSSGFYPANELVVTEVIDNDGRKRQVVQNKAGQKLLTRVQLDEIINGANVPWLETYYIYYTAGNLRYMISPKGVEALKSGSWSFTQSIKDQYVYEFTYDLLGRLVEKKTPGQAPIYYCYDNLNRLLLVQDGNIRSQNKWFYIKYDRAGRPVMQGLYTNATYTTRTSLQANVIDVLFTSPSTKYYEERGTVSHGYTNQVFPTSGTEVMTVNYYGSHDFDFNGSADYSYSAQSLSGEGTPGPTVIGLPTGSKRIILGTSTWLSEYYFYDADGRMIQKRSNNHLSSTIDNLSTIVYDFEGKIKYQKTYHKTATNTTTVLNRYVYDHAGRLKEILQSNNGASEHLIAQYHYNELGQLVDKKLHYVNSGREDFLQSVDFRYNIQGWIKSINNSELTSDGVKNDESNDLFGMEMLYNETEAGLSSTGLYSGNIHALKWKGAGVAPGSEDVRSYIFDYDKSNKLETATYQSKGATAWDQKVNAFNESMSYDHNGNILTLQRHTENLGVAQLMDNLTYTYNNGNGNSLQRITDGATAAGFDNGTSGTNADYTYDSQGNLTKDENKGINAITYNVLGKPSLVTYTDGRQISYTYDAAGNKLTMAVTVSSVTTTTDYVGGFVYENANLSFFSAPEGRVVKNGSALEHQYAIADHQGNTRVVFTSAAVPVTSVANFESGTNNNFLNYNNRVSFELMDHTDVSGTTHTYSQKLTGGVNSQVGIAKSMKVYPGDKVKIEAYAKYYNPTGTSSNITGFAAALTSAFGVSGSSTGEALKAFEALDDYGVFIAGGGPEDTDEDYPKLFVNILLFDKDHNFLDAAWQQIDGGEQVGVSPKAAHDFMSREVTVKEAGYAYIYVSNESATMVEFYVDDVTITHTPTAVIQYNEYYPFGLQNSNSWTRENHTNNFLYNAGNELNQTSGWYEMFYRGYDPVTGRMLQIDPYAGMYVAHTPYNYAVNNPIMVNDPTGGLASVLDNLIERNERLADLTGTGAYGGGGGGGYGRGAIQRWSSKLQDYIDAFFRTGGGEPSVYNRWCECMVKASEVLSYEGQGQNKEYRAMAQAAMDKYNADHDLLQKAEEWITDHLYSELAVTVTGGPQIAITPVKGGFVPAFIRGGPVGVKINLGSMIIHKEQIDSDNGYSQTFWTQGVVTQGVGFSSGFGSVEWNRTLENGEAKDTITGSVLNGLIGLEYNVQTKEVFIGTVSSGSIIFGFGVEGNAKFGLRFNFGK